MVCGFIGRFLMLPLEPYEGASRQSFDGFLPYRAACLLLLVAMPTPS
jgi:hypothetical protein